MASVQLYTAVKSYLQAQLAPVPVLDYDQLEPTLEQGSDPFVVLNELFGDEVLVSFGDPSGVCLRETCSIGIQCYVPAPHASNAGRAIAEQVQRSLRMRSISGVRVLDVTPPDPGDLNDGLWSEIVVTGDFQLDRIEPMP